MKISCQPRPLAKRCAGTRFDFMHELKVPNRGSLRTFKTSLDNILQKDVPVKKRCVWENQAPFINKKYIKK